MSTSLCQLSDVLKDGIITAEFEANPRLEDLHFEKWKDVIGDDCAKSPLLEETPWTPCTGITLNLYSNPCYIKSTDTRGLTSFV